MLLKIKRKRREREEGKGSKELGSCSS